MLLMEPPASTDERLRTGDTAAAGATWLLARLDALTARFALPMVATSSLPLPAEAAALAQGGLAETAFLACLAACVFRHTDAGPAVAHGPWADSAVLAHCGGVLRADSDTADIALSARAIHESFLAHIARGVCQGPLLLLPDAPTATTLDALAAEARRYDLTVRAEARGGVTRVFPVHELFEGEGVALVVSGLWRAVCMATNLLDEHYGYRCHPLTPIILDEHLVLERLSSPWATVLPETPLWLTEGRVGPDRASWDRLWFDNLGGEVPEPTWAALRARAALVWQFASLAALAPSLAWSAVLAVTEPARWTAMLDAARRDAGSARVPSSEECSRAEMLEHGVASGAAPTSGATPPLVAGSLDQEDAARGVVGSRAFHYGEQALELLALAGSAGAAAEVAHTILPEEIARTSVPAGINAPFVQLIIAAPGGPGVEGAPDVMPDGETLAVSAALTKLLAASRVVVRVPLAGEPNTDIDLLNRVIAVLRAHEGPQPVRVFLERGAARRTLDRPDAPGVLWSSPLAAELADLLGPGRVLMEPPVVAAPEH